MVDYPVSFKSSAEAEKGSQQWEVSTDENLQSDMTVPEEFGGDSENPSPEDLFNASLATCIVATYKITAERKNLDYSNIEAECETLLDRNKDGRPVMKKSEIQITVKQVSDQELAEEVGEITERNCFIHNSVKTQVETEFNYTY